MEVVPLRFPRTRKEPPIAALIEGAEGEDAEIEVPEADAPSRGKHAGYCEEKRQPATTFSSRKRPKSRTNRAVAEGPARRRPAQRGALTCHLPRRPGTVSNWVRALVPVRQAVTLFHGGHTGSNPVGDASEINRLMETAEAISLSYGKNTAKLLVEMIG